MKKILRLLAGLLLLSGTAKAQPYYFRHYQVENGLSHNTVFCTVQDKDGFLWFGTKDGLNRFDGYHFKTFTIIKEGGGSLTRDLILSLAADRQGAVWVGTQKGLFRFDAESETFNPFLDTIHGINDIFFDKSGQLWFIGDNTLNRYNFKTKQLTPFPPERYFNATSFCETADGTMWISTNDGYLQQFDAVTHSFKAYDVFKHSTRAQSRHIQKIMFRPKGSIMIGTTDQGIKKFDLLRLDYQDILTHNPNKTTIYVRDILQVDDQETWFATETGIFILNNASGEWVNLKKKTLDPYSLSDNAIYTLCKDAEGGIWAGTFFGGINYIPRQQTTFQKYFPDYTPNSVSGNAVREICEDGTGNIWIGTEDAGLNKLDPKTGLVTKFEPTGNPGSIAYSNIHALLAVKDELWVGTFEHGLDIMDIHTGKVKKHYCTGKGNLQSNFIISFLKTRSGSIYLTTPRGVYRYNPKEDNFQIEETAEGSFTPCLLEDHTGTIWIGTHGTGLFYFDPLTGAEGHFQNIPGNENSLTNNWINSLYEDSSGSLWLATEGGGLCRLDKSRTQFTRYSTKNGLPSNFVFKVLEDNKRTLWVTTSKGLVHLDAAAQEGIKVYTKADGLLNDQFNYNSGYKDKQGNLYFGSVQGMIKFNPDAFRRNQFIPPVYITGMEVQNKEMLLTRDSGILEKSILYTDRITLPHDQSSFNIDFAALSFTSPETTEYSYIMEGLDNEWTFLQRNRKVYFTNLKPGGYTFRVKAGNNGVWNEQQTRTLSIIISSPYWATPWAYLSYSLLVILLSYYFIRTYLHIQENKKEKEIYQAKTEFFTNIAHEIKTPLTLIKGPVENLSEMVGQVPDIREDIVTLERNTNRLVNLINQILDFSRTEAKGFSLHFSEVIINEILREAYETFKPLAQKKKLNYSLKLPPVRICMMADTEALTKILHNLFSNAVKYAQREVTAQLIPPHQDENRLIFEITNDGCSIPREMKEKIFEPFFRIKETNNQKGTGLGLALARSLVELHNGTIYVKNTESSCNTFVVELPFPSQHNKRKNTTETNNQIA